MRTKTQKVTGWIARLAVVALGAAFSLAANAQGGRVLAKSDVIQIKVVSQPDMDTTTRIESDGTVNFPYVGRIKAAGLSEEQLAHAIERRLSERQICHRSARARRDDGLRRAGKRPGPGRGSWSLHSGQDDRLWRRSLLGQAA